MKIAVGSICPKCDKPILPGQSWDLGHNESRRGYNGPEHAKCNRATKKPRRQSRPW